MTAFSPLCAGVSFRTHGHTGTSWQRSWSRRVTDQPNRAALVLVALSIFWSPLHIVCNLSILVLFSSISPVPPYCTKLPGAPKWAGRLVRLWQSLELPPQRLSNSHRRFWVHLFFALKPFSYGIFVLLVLEPIFRPCIVVLAAWQTSLGCFWSIDVGHYPAECYSFVWQPCLQVSVCEAITST